MVMILFVKLRVLLSETGQAKGEEKVEAKGARFDARRADSCYVRVKNILNFIRCGYRVIPDIDSLEYRDLLHMDVQSRFIIALPYVLR